MAKGNLFQGNAKGKLGDIVFSVVHGEQVSKAYNPRPNNANTNEQILQRAIMSTVVQAYSQGSAIFDHSFENASFGAENMAVFTSLNCKMLRNKVALKANGQLSSTDCYVAAPGSLCTQPNNFIVSKGRLLNQLMAFQPATATTPVKVHLNPTMANTNVPAGFRAFYLDDGDFLTFLFFELDYNNPVFTYDGEVCYNSRFSFVRLLCACNQFADEQIIGFNIGRAFQVDEATNGRSVNLDFTVINGSHWDDFSTAVNVDPQWSIVSMACVRSKKNLRLRSSETMFDFSPRNALCGLTYPNFVSAWKDEITPLGYSDLILEGADV